MDIDVTSRALAAMRAAADAAHPNEACGLLLGEGARITEARQTRNVHPQPAAHFEIDPQALIDAHRAARAGAAAQVIGYFHSHPTGDPVPSATDQAMAASDGRVWAILGSERITFWRDGNSAGKAGFAALSFTMIES
jgi:proteasome lid subunit RPN8/RPN11